MAKKKDEKDVLVVRDEKTGEISVVAGLNADGTPKRTPAKAENAQSFLQFDRQGDVLDNFFKNFFRQCKEPSRFGFYRIAADQVDSMLGVMKDLLQHPYQNKQILAPHKIDTFPYQQQVQEEMAAQKTEKQEPQKQENMEQQKEQQESPQQTQGRQGYQPINESKINWQELEDRWGVKPQNQRSRPCSEVPVLPAQGCPLLRLAPVPVPELMTVSRMSVAFWATAAESVRFPDSVSCV